MTGTAIGLSIVTGVLASLAASLIFWFGVQRVKPRLAISTEIARTPRDGVQDECRFRFKILNLSRRAAVDLQIRAYIDTPRKVPGGEIRVMKPLRVHSTPGSVLPGRKKGDAQARHARRIRFDVDLDEIWTDEQHDSLIVRVYARDGSSGYVSEYEQTYPLRRCIKDGSFEFGDSMKVVT